MKLYDNLLVPFRFIVIAACIIDYCGADVLVPYDKNYSLKDNSYNTQVIKALSQMPPIKHVNNSDELSLVVKQLESLINQTVPNLINSLRQLDATDTGKVHKLFAIEKDNNLDCAQMKQDYAHLIDLQNKYAIKLEYLKTLNQQLRDKEMDTEQLILLLTKINACIDEMNVYSTQIMAGFPAKYQVKDKRVVYKWKVDSRDMTINWQDSWSMAFSSFYETYVALPGYTWEDGQGTVDDLNAHVFVTTSTKGEDLINLERYDSASYICLEDKSLVVSGWLSIMYNCNSGTFAQCKAESLRNLDGCIGDVCFPIWKNNRLDGPRVIAGFNTLQAF